MDWMDPKGLLSFKFYVTANFLEQTLLNEGMEKVGFALRDVVADHKLLSLHAKQSMDCFAKQGKKIGPLSITK